MGKDFEKDLDDLFNRDDLLTKEVEVVTDADCSVYCDGELISYLTADVRKTIRVSAGKHEFVFKTIEGRKKTRSVEIGDIPVSISVDGLSVPPPQPVIPAPKPQPKTVTTPKESTATKKKRKKKRKRRGIGWVVGGIAVLLILILFLFGIFGGEYSGDNYFDVQDNKNQPVALVIPRPSPNGSILQGSVLDNFVLKRVSSEKYPYPSSSLYEKFGLEKDVKEYSVLDSDLSMFPGSYKGQRILSCDYWAGSNYYYVYYGQHARHPYLLLFDNEYNVKYELDFSEFLFSSDFDISNAKLVGNTLYIHHGYNGNAYLNYGLNAYISAIDLETNTILWTSKPLSCFRDFIIIANTIVTGYGFTEEDDYVYLIDRATGKTRQTIKVASAPEEFALKNNKVYVRTYDTDYVFDIVTK